MKIKHLLIPLIIIAIIILWFLLKEKEQPPRPINVVTKKVEEPPKIAKTPIDPNKYIEELNKATDDRRAFLKEKQEREDEVAR